MTKLEYLQLLGFFKIFSEEERLKIFLILLKNNLCVCELVKELKLPQNLISYHLKVLKDFNLIFLKKKGRKNYYLVDKKELNKYFKLIKKILS